MLEKDHNLILGSEEKTSELIFFERGETQDVLESIDRSLLVNGSFITGNNVDLYSENNQSSEEEFIDSSPEEIMISQTKPNRLRIGRKRNVKNSPQNNVEEYPLDITKNLHAHFFEVTNIEGLKEMEKTLGFIELFDGFKFLVAPPRFFGMVSSFYAVFKLTELPAVVSLFSPEDSVFITKDFVKINGEKIAYINSYSGSFKEHIIYKPLLLAFGGKKHFIRSQNVRKFSEVIEKINSTINVEEVLNSPVLKEDVKFIIENFGSRSIKKAIQFEGKESELNEEALLAHVTTTKDLISLLENILEKNQENILTLRAYINFSKKFTTRILSDKENLAIF